MTLDRTSARAFARVAEQYERRRPSYPAEIVAWVVERLGLGPGTSVADIGAGTGKFTRLLVPTGAHVIAVEPLPEMLKQLRLAVAEVDARPGSAEELPLEDASVDGVTAAAAFHWFDLDLALPEIHRVLKPGGGFAVVRNYRDLSDPLQAAVQEVIGRYVPHDSALEGWHATLEASDLFGPLDSVHARHEQLLDAKGLAERIGTVSYVAGLPDEERAGVLARVHALGEAQPEEMFAIRYRTDGFVCFRRDDE